MRHTSIYIVLSAFLLGFLVGCRPSASSEKKVVIDSLNTRAYHFRYIDIDTVSHLSKQVLQLSTDYADGLNEARQNLAFVEYQQMNFDGVDSILNLIYRDCHNHLLLLCADVMEMKTTQRTEDGERFFRAKSRAENRMARIREEQDELSSRELSLWVYAQTEFHLISSTYYYYQEQDSLAQVEVAKVLPYFELSVDTAQWVYYNYMLGPGRLVDGDDWEDITLREFDYLYKAYSLSSRLQMRYFEANTLQAFASMFLNYDSLIAERRSDAYRNLCVKYRNDLLEDDDISLTLCRNALALFKAYNDLFQTACTYRTLGEIHFEREEYEQALESYCNALHCVNLHHLRYYGDISPDTLMAFNPNDLQRSVEKEWIDDSRISTVPEWISGIRQQLSLTFSALGMKQASDYNRNFYLDLLQATNQNLELENRSAELQRQTKALYARMLLCLVLLTVALVLFALFRYRLKRQSVNSIKGLQTILSYLKKECYPSDFPVRQQHLLQPYISFLDWNDSLLAELQEKKDEAEERLQLITRRMAENKRKNAENRAKVSLVHAIVPFLDRIGGEVIRMEQEQKVAPERKAYVVELVDQIEQYNAILTDWIKMEQGQLNLHISKVSLNHLFSIVAEGHYAFDQKSIALCVDETSLYVKADESLTLFMINTLAENARKFTPKGGRVTLSAKAENNYVEISVTDTGCGLTEEEVDILTNNKVYDASKIGQNAEGKGFGFGLMNCRGIIEKYKKTSSLFASCAFGVRSQVGKGSTFFFRLPQVFAMLAALFCIPVTTYAGNVYALYDSVYQANVEGRYSDAIRYADMVLDDLNQTHPQEPPLRLMDTWDGQQYPSDLRWAQTGVPVNYNLITGLRNEVSLAALALHDWPLYHYNNRICIRLHKYIHQDNSLPTYYHRLEQTHQNSNLLLFFILVAAVIILILSYKLLVSSQMKIERGIEDLKRYCRHLLEVARVQPSESDFIAQTSEWPEMKEWALRFQKQVLDMSVTPINNLMMETARFTDEVAKQEYEDNRIYVQNQVLDNCLSTIKHESMYYPSRIRQLVDKMKDEDIEQLSELVRYYHHIYTLLCNQADAQVAQPGFKRQHVDARQALSRACEASRRLAKRQKMCISIKCIEKWEDEFCAVLADEFLLGTLFESLILGMLHDGAIFTIRGEEDGRFIRYTLSDDSVQLSDEQLANFFYPESHSVSYLVAKQILREHDTYSNHPGCRLNAEATEKGYQIYFTLLKIKR